MRRLPLADPGTPDSRSAWRFLLWLRHGQGTIIAGNVGFGIVSMACMATMPAVMGRAVDAGVAARDSGALLFWSLALLALGSAGAVARIIRHRFAVMNWLATAYRTVRVVVRHATGVAATLPKRVATGEVVSIGAADVEHLGQAMESTGRGVGAVFAYGVVTAVLFATAPWLGVVVLVGVPLLAGAAMWLLRPLYRRQHQQRELAGELTTVASDIVAGLRVLRGVGGEEAFGARYRQQSQRVRHAAVAAARVQSTLDALQVLLPGVCVAGVTWLGARFALAGAVTPGELVACYGYAAFLIMPLRNATETAKHIARAHVSARRVVRVLQIRPEITDPPQPLTLPVGGSPGELADPVSGLCVPPGRFVAVAATTPEDGAALADRLGRYAEGDVTWGGVRLADLPVAAVRERILVADTEARLFSGRLRDELDPTGSATDEAVAAALHTASAEDVIDALPDGLDTLVTERARSLSGGQRQRLLLVRALLTNPEVLVLVEPTSAVDAHTEARIADRLSAARTGRTTVVMTTSPLVLDRADRVCFVETGKLVATGTHAELLAAEPRYRATVTRGEDT